MADTKTWLGGTSTAYATAANWDTVTVPATGDTLIYNHQAQQGCLTGCDAGSNAHTYPKVIVTSGYKYGLAANGDPLDPTAFTKLYWSSGFTGTSYLKGDIDDGTFEAPEAGAGMVEIDGTMNHIALNGGTVQLTANADLNSGDKLFVMTESRGVPSRLIIDSGATLTTSHIVMNGGQLVTLASPVTLTVNGGVAILRGTAAIATMLNIDGDGIVDWDSTGTVAMFHVRGDGLLRSVQFTRAKTLTEGHMYGNGRVDLRCKGGQLLTLTAGIIVHGANSPLFAPGSVISVA